MCKNRWKCRQGCIGVKVLKGMPIGGAYLMVLLDRMTSEILYQKNPPVPLF